MKITVDVQGVAQTIAAFEKVQGGIADLRKNATWLRVQQQYYREVKSIFAAEGGKSGGWQELSSPYKEIKAKRYGNKPILQATGRMYKSLVQANHPDAVVDKQAQSMTLGSSVPYGGFHQSGTGRMPARPPIDFSADAEERILKPIGDSLRQLAANAKLRDLRGF